tara:strand:+ start:1744 stop:1929 length:186 start_codon:yes stop_codon:yes gene_type:complete
MKHKLLHSLYEAKKVQKDLYEVCTTDYWDNGTYTVKDISHHSTEREAQEQKQINKDKNQTK